MFEFYFYLERVYLIAELIRFKRFILLFTVKLYN